MKTVALTREIASHHIIVQPPFDSCAALEGFEKSDRQVGIPTLSARHYLV
jgi:hypothetical protein